MDPALLARISGRAPRYTSYPTAPHFQRDFPEAAWRDWLGAIPADAPLSLYLHVPFCRKVCWYCGCNMKLAAREAPVRAYMETLLSEIDLLAEASGGRRVARIHWGGGTPTAAPEDCLRAAMDRLRARFGLADDAEIAVEIDPRTLEDSMARALGEMGVNRVSLGVQEFDARVQAMVNRVQPFDMVAEKVAALRAAGIARFNFDLMYGLPGQTVETVEASAARAVELHPDRIALFGYAHVPWMAKNQRMLPEDRLPDIAARFAQAEAAARVLMGAGYDRIGLDHFARRGDSLAKAAQAGRMRRNFQGYVDDDCAHLLGLGASSISATPQGYAQNRAETRAWAREVEAGRLPVSRGLVLSEEDRLRGAVIERLMCDLQVDPAVIAFAHGAAPDHFFAERDALRAFEADGLVEIEGSLIRVTDRGRPALRSVAAVFDAYFTEQNKARHAAVA